MPNNNEQPLVLADSTYVCRFVVTTSGVLEGVRHKVILRTLVDVEQIQLDINDDDTPTRHPSNTPLLSVGEFVFTIRQADIWMLSSRALIVTALWVGLTSEGIETAEIIQNG